MGSERFTQRMSDPKVRHDLAVLADFVQIWCDGHHADRLRGQILTPGYSLGVYRSRPLLCQECEAHLAYAEKRRALCPKDPKPFCAHCDSHCYRSGERAWQQEMMRYSGPKSWRKGHAIDGIRHVLEARKWKREMARTSAKGSSASHTERP